MRARAGRRDGFGSYRALGAATLLALAAPAYAETAVTTVTPPPASSPFAATAIIDDSLEVTGETLASPNAKNRPTVGIIVNGKGPFRFLVDSGADRTVVGAALAQRLSLPAEDSVMLHSMAGSGMVDTVRVEELGLGRGRIHDIVAPALPEQFLGAQGVLGIDALAEERIEFDFDKNTITVQDARKPVSGASDEIVVTARLRKGQLILTQVRAGNVGLYAIIDSGSDVTVANSELRKKLFRNWNNVKTSTVSLMSVTGQSFTAEMAVVPEMHVGGLILRNVSVAFADPPPFRLFGLSKQPALLLGSDVLQVFSRVGLDFRGRKVRFRMRG